MGFALSQGQDRIASVPFDLIPQHVLGIERLPIKPGEMLTIQHVKAVTQTVRTIGGFDPNCRLCPIVPPEIPAGKKIVMSTNEHLISVTTKTPIGTHSHPLRFLIVALVVAAYWVLGYLLHLGLPAYQLLGVVMLLVFQLGIQRQPLRTLWVRSGPPIQLDARFYTLWFFFSLLPAYGVVKMLLQGNFVNTLFAGVAIAGAFGLSYALGFMSKTWRQLGLCILTVTIIAILPQVLLRLFSNVLNLHFVIRHSSIGAATPTLLQSLWAGLQTFLIGLPLGFIVEEVFFRGALDTYLHCGEVGTGWFSAIFVSALWGLWHMPHQGILASTVVGLLVPQILIGVPLSLFWRKSGNLAVNSTSHALLDAFRNGLAGTGLF